MADRLKRLRPTLMGPWRNWQRIRLLSGKVWVQIPPALSKEKAKRQKDREAHAIFPFSFCLEPGSRC